MNVLDSTHVTLRKKNELGLAEKWKVFDYKAIAVRETQPSDR